MILTSYLQDHYSNTLETLEVKIDEHNGAIWISASGYGTMIRPSDDIIVLEVCEGELRLQIWNDINKEDPITVSLEKAKESNYERET